MKKLLYLLILLNAVNLFSQKNTSKITIEFKDITTKEVIRLLEKKTAYTFFFLEDWLDKKKKTNTFIDASINEILDAIFNETKINYFITDAQKIILTQGTIIRSPVYKNVQSVQDEVQHKAPIIIADFEKIDFVVGKETTKRENFYYISGIIKNDSSNKNLEGVTVFEKEKNVFTTTDSKGYYRLKLPYGKNQLQVAFIGYQKEVKSIIVYNSGTINFSLLEKSEQLDEINISATKNKNIKQTITGVTQIKAEGIKNIPQILGERDLLKAATTLPGIKSAGEGAEGINVRGGKVDQNLFLLDEGVIYNPTHFLGLFSAINPFTTDELKIYKGNIPAEYGGRLSSVFNITTKEANIQKFSGEASIGPVTGNISIETPIIKDKSGLLLGFRSTYSDWILKSIDNKNLQNSSVSFYDVIAKYHHKINKNNALKITGYYSNDTFQIASDSINSYRNTLASFNWNHTFNEKNRSNLIVSNSNYDFNIDYESTGNRNFNLKYTINETDLKLKMQYLRSKKHLFTYGIESKLYDVSPGIINPNGEDSSIIPIEIAKERALESGLFFSDALTLNKKLTFDIGVRFSQYLALGASEQRIYQENAPKNDATLVATVSSEKNEIFKTYQGLSYRFSGRYSLNDNLSIKGGFNKSFQYIHRLSNNTTASPMDTWRLSDTNIKPQEAMQLSLGVFKNLDNDIYELSIEGYYKKYENLLDYKVGANLLLNETIETDVLQGAGKSYGIEFLITKKSGKLNGWLSYSYARSLIQLDGDFNEEIVNNGTYFPTNYDKPHNLDVVLNYKITERYSLSSNFSYQTGRPITYPTGKYIYQGVEYLTYSDRNGFRIPDYYRLDIGLNIEGNHKIKKFAHSFWNISVYNVLGRNNPYSVYFETTNGNVKGYKSSIFSTPIPTITYNFKF